MTDKNIDIKGLISEQDVISDQLNIEEEYILTINNNNKRKKIPKMKLINIIINTLFYFSFTIIIGLLLYFIILLYGQVNKEKTSHIIIIYIITRILESIFYIIIFCIFKINELINKCKKKY